MFIGARRQFLSSVRSVLGAFASRWSLRFGLGRVVVVAALCAVAQYAAASNCGSYVIANPTLHGKQIGDGMHMMAAGAASLGSAAHDGSMPHIPTPCERGFCRGPDSVPFVPPSAPIANPVEHVLLQLTFSIAPSRQSLGNFRVCLAHPCSGFRLPLERPPESSHV